jgi:DNA-directed RNA polymerase specialized sigma24 family protein
MEGLDSGLLAGFSFPGAAATPATDWDELLPRSLSSTDKNRLSGSAVEYRVVRYSANDGPSRDYFRRALAGTAHMSAEGSVTRLLFELRRGRDEAVSQLWERYFRKLAELAHHRLQRRAWGGVDEEDVALSALHSFVNRVTHGDFPGLRGRDDLWRLLAAIANRKALNAIRDELTQRRGGGHTLQSDSVFERVFREEPTPAEAAEMLDETDRLLNVVLARAEPTLRVIAMRTLRGDDRRMIAHDLGVSLRTIERKNQVIQLLWKADLESRFPGS